MGAIQKLVFWNASAGKASSNTLLEQHFRKESIRTVEMTRQTDLCACIADAASAGCDTVVAAGGDGTVNAVVNALMHFGASTRPKLAIIPLGTANDFACTLYVPDDPIEAAKLLNTSQFLPVDVVRIKAQNFECFYANIAAGGNSVRVSEEMTDELKSNWGAFCYLRGAMEVLTELDSFHIYALCGDETIAGEDTWAVLVANGRTSAGRIVVAPRASPIDGLLDVIIIRDGNILDIIEIVTSELLGTYVDCDQVTYRQVKRLQLHSKPGMRFTIDGEVIDQEPVEFEVIAGAVQVYVGSQFLLDQRAQLVEHHRSGQVANETQNA